MWVSICVSVHNVYMVSVGWGLVDSVNVASLVYYLAKCCEVSVFALHQELSCDVSRWLHLTGLFILLMQLLHFLLSSHHLNKSRHNSINCVRRVSCNRGRKYMHEETLFRRSLSSSWVFTIFFQCSICSSFTCFSCSLNRDEQRQWHAIIFSLLMTRIAFTPRLDSQLSETKYEANKQFTHCMTTSSACPRDTGLLLRKLKSSWWLRYDVASNRRLNSCSTISSFSLGTLSNYNH